MKNIHKIDFLLLFTSFFLPKRRKSYFISEFCEEKQSKKMQCQFLLWISW